MTTYPNPKISTRPPAEPEHESGRAFGRWFLAAQRPLLPRKLQENQQCLGQNRSKFGQNQPKMIQNGPKWVKIGTKWYHMAQNGFFGTFEILPSLLGAFPLYSLQLKKKRVFSLKTEIATENGVNLGPPIFRSGPHGPPEIRKPPALRPRRRSRPAALLHIYLLMWTPG